MFIIYQNQWQRYLRNDKLISQISIRAKDRRFKWTNEDICCLVAFNGTMSPPPYWHKAWGLGLNVHSFILWTVVFEILHVRDKKSTVWVRDTASGSHISGHCAARTTTTAADLPLDVWPTALCNHTTFLLCMVVVICLPIRVAAHTIDMQCTPCIMAHTIDKFL